MVNVVDSTLFAKYLNTKARNQGIEMNITKLMKLMYICYGTYLAVYNERLLNEQPQAWPYGPVFATARQEMNIQENWIDKRESLGIENVIETNKIDNIINVVLKTFGKLSAVQLSTWTHQAGSPWEKTVSSYAYGTPISDLIIKSYFDKLIIKH